MATGAYIGAADIAHKIKGGYIGIDGIARKIVKAYIGVAGVARLCWASVKIVPWSTGTDEEIAAMLAAHYAGLIDVRNYWAVGQERKVRISAMNAMAPLDDSHIEQEITLVLLHAGQYPLTEGGTCAFVIGMKARLTDTNGRMSKDAKKAGGWDNCDRRTWSNGTFYNSFPATLRPIFKKINTVTTNGEDKDVAVTSSDYFAPPAVTEINDDLPSYSAIPAEQGLFKFEYYEIPSNIPTYVWLRSGYYDSMRDGYGYSISTGSGSFTSNRADQASGILMIGAI